MNTMPHTSGGPAMRSMLFDRTGLLKLLDEDYEDLHGMSMEYLMQFFDRYLEGAA